MSRPLVSCIIPVYNAEKYLEQGIDSLLAQTYENLEIILIDDVSTDGSWAICEKYADIHPNISAFKRARNSGGPLRGRQTGIAKSRGEWVTFMDCDDYVTPTYIEHLVEATENGKYDIAVTGHSRLQMDGTIEDFLWDDYAQTTKQRMSAFYKHFINGVFWTDPTDTVGQSLVRATIAKKTDLSKYSGTVWAEDTLMALAFLSNTEHGVNFVDHHDFIWRQRQNSGSHGGFSARANKPEFYRACYEIFNERALLPLVSIIIPVYMVEKYINACLDSVTAQTYPHLEVVVVDDHSQDASGSIADALAIKDERVKVIHKERNGGLNAARETGFKASTGEYVLFVDSDDALSADSVRVAMNALLKNAADFVRFGNRTFKGKADLNDTPVNPEEEVQVILNTKKELYLTLFDQEKVLPGLPILSMTVWGAIYTRKSVERIDWSLSNYRAYEDNYWTLRYLENASCGVYINHIGYLYRYDESMTNVLSKRLTGNDFNGQPIGYLEGLDRIRSLFSEYNKKYKVGAEEAIDNETELLFMHRSHYLSSAGLWGTENNTHYIPKLMDIYQGRLSTLMNVADTQAELIKKLETENAKLKQELSSHMSVKRSAKLALGNVKRRIVKSTRRTPPAHT